MGDALLKWFEGVAKERGMPWRKAWIDPTASESSSAETMRQDLEKRAYEVWISEISEHSERSKA